MERIGNPCLQTDIGVQNVQAIPPKRTIFARAIESPPNETHEFRGNDLCMGAG
jgi:hypothetical protein